MSSILQVNYKETLSLFCKYLQNNYSDRKINIKIDTIAGEKFQKECLKIIRNTTKNKLIKAKFVNSKSDSFVQISDVFAAINRLGNKHKIIDSILSKNKSL